jgi:hypothetical protein
MVISAEFCPLSRLCLLLQSNQTVFCVNNHMVVRLAESDPAIEHPTFFPQDFISGVFYRLSMRTCIWDLCFRFADPSLPTVGYWFAILRLNVPLIWLTPIGMGSNHRRLLFTVSPVLDLAVRFIPKGCYVDFHWVDLG